MLLRLQRALSRGAPKVVGGGGSLLAPVIQRMCWPPPGVASVSFVISVRAYPQLPEGPE
jgi:hypothetical protein